MRRIAGAAAVLVTAGTVLAATIAPPAQVIAAATDSGIIAVLDKADATQVYATFQPFRSQSPVNVAVGDFDGDGLDDVVAAADGSVRVLTSGGAGLRSFTPFSGFTGGVRVAVGDVNGDGVADIVAGAGRGLAGGPVKVFDGSTLALNFTFQTQPPDFLGGVFVGAGDLDGDGHDDIIVGSDGELVPAVKVFNGATGQLHASFLAYDSSFTGGVRVAAADVNGDGQIDIITGAGPGAPGGHVKVFDGRSLALLASFLPFDTTYTGGVHVAGAAGSVAVTPGATSGAVATIRLFAAGADVQWLMPFPSYKGGLTVAQSSGVMGKAPSRPKIPGYDLQTTC